MDFGGQSCPILLNRLSTWFQSEEESHLGYNQTAQPQLLEKDEVQTSKGVGILETSYQGKD